MSNEFLIKFDDSGSNEIKIKDKNVWSTERVNDLMGALDDGYKIKGGTRFYDRNPVLKKGNIAWSYTPEEKAELRKCAKDIVYFANKYATVMTDDGLQTIALRDYQDEMLKTFVDNRFNVCLASRQIGKCLAFYTDIYIRKDNIESKIKLYELWHLITDLKILNFKERLIHFTKYYLYKIYCKLDRYEK
jgi:hypothetical protein